VSQID
jgi:K+-sensing histidine kinase KdpD